MNKTKRKPELNVDLIGGESLSEIEKQQLSTFFREQKEKQQKRRTKRAVCKKKDRTKLIG